METTVWGLRFRDIARKGESDGKDEQTMKRKLASNRLYVGAYSEQLQ